MTTPTHAVTPPPSEEHLQRLNSSALPEPRLNIFPLLSHLPFR